VTNPHPTDFAHEIRIRRMQILADSDTSLKKPVKHKYVVLPYCRAEMYTGCRMCCPWWVTVSMPVGQTYRWTDARLLHNAFHTMASDKNLSHSNITMQTVGQQLLQYYTHTTLLW